jgi:hypothetical protein
MQDFRKMVFFAALAPHSHKSCACSIYLFREHNTCLEKGAKVLCLLELWVLPQSLLGRGSPARYFLEHFTCCAGLPLRSRLQAYQSGVVYDGFLNRQQARPQGMKNAIPSLSPFLAFFMGYRSVLPHKKCLTGNCPGTAYPILPQSRVPGAGK